MHGAQQLLHPLVGLLVEPPHAGPRDQRGEPLGLEGRVVGADQEQPAAGVGDRLQQGQVDPR